MSRVSRGKRQVAAVVREQERFKRRDEREYARLQAVVDRRKRKLEQAQRNLASFAEKIKDHNKALDASPQAKRR